MLTVSASEGFLAAGGTATFDNSHGYGFEEVISLQALRSPAKGYLDSHRQFHILITISVPEVGPELCS